MITQPTKPNAAELAYDLHAGLSSHQVADFDDLTILGMAASVSIHVKGLGEISYEVMRKVSDHYLAIPSVALEKVLRLLKDVGYVRLIEIGRRIDKVIPNIPPFRDVFLGLDAFAASELKLNEIESAMIGILGALYDAPRNKDTLFNTLGVGAPVFDRCLKVGSASGIVSLHEARGRKVLISPYYFTDNLDSLADLSVAAGSSAISSALQKIKLHQGWPLSLIDKQGEIGGVKLAPTEKEVISNLAAEGILKPPTIKFGTKTQTFVFTPRPGNTRLNAANREVYERAMALISAVRKGQLLPNSYRIRSPLAILSALESRGYLKANSEAWDQYQNLVFLRVAILKQASPGFWQLHLNNTEENKAALRLAIELLRTGQAMDMAVDEEARIALTKDEQYIQSLISSRELKSRPRQIVDRQAKEEFEQLLLKLG